MTYVMGNVHGCYAEFTELLKKIEFKDKDILYILGDIVDYGDEPMELIGDISMRYNVYCVAGEHDFRAVKMLHGFEKMLKSGDKPSSSYIKEMNAWMSEGGQSTLDGFRGLDDEMKEGVIDYLSDMSMFEEVTVNGKDYLLVHSGVGDLASGGDGDCEPKKFFSKPVDPAVRCFEDKTVIFSHIPTSEIKGAVPGKIYKGDGMIGIDCGAGRDGVLACLRLEDGEEFYA